MDLRIKKSSPTSLSQNVSTRGSSRWTTISQLILQVELWLTMLSHCLKDMTSFWCLSPSEGDYGAGRGGAGAGGRLSRMREAGPGGGGYGNPTGTGPPSAQGYNTTYNAQPAPMAM